MGWPWVVFYVENSFMRVHLPVWKFVVVSVCPCGVVTCNHFLLLTYREHPEIVNLFYFLATIIKRHRRLGVFCLQSNVIYVSVEQNTQDSMHTYIQESLLHKLVAWGVGGAWWGKARNGSIGGGDKETMCCLQSWFYCCVVTYRANIWQKSITHATGTSF
jgi:hypothetical protein